MITDKQKQFISVVVYVRDNEERLKAFLPVLTGTLENNFENYEIVCVADDTHDKSVEYIRSYIGDSDRRHMVTVIEMSSHQGLELSMNAGVDLAIGDLIIEFDNIGADYSEELIMEAYRKAVSGYDVVSVAPDSDNKAIGSKAFYNLFNWGASNNFNPISSEDFRIVSRRALNRIKAINQYIPYRKALYSQCGLPCTKIVYRAKNKQAPKESVNNRINLALETLILFTNAIQRITLLICFLFALITVAVGVYIVYGYFFGEKPVEGWTTLMAFLTLGFFGMFLLFFIVFKYLSVVLNTVFIKQRYSVKSINRL